MKRSIETGLKLTWTLGFYWCSSEAPLAKYGTYSVTSSTAIKCALPPPPLPPKRQWKPCVVLRSKGKQKQNYQVCDFTEVCLQELIRSLLKSREVLKPSIVTALPSMCIHERYFLEDLCTLVCWRYLKTISWKKTWHSKRSNNPKPQKTTTTDHQKIPN